jgi:ubiquinone/menaquinone biosynthesis C-methylase UbiE
MIAIEAPDIETSSADYASRFRGRAGRYLLQTQTWAIERAIRDLKPGSVLDVGGGHGQLVEPLRRLGWRVTVQGSDEECARNLRELHGQRDCEFLRSSLFAIPVPDRSFDLVVAVRLLSHVQDWPRLIGELCRVARQAVILDYPSKLALNALTPLLFAVKKSFEGNTRTYESFSRRELAAEFARRGFYVKREVKQFFLPMALHRAGNAAAILRGAEVFSRTLGLTTIAGSPVIFRADRTADIEG